jgi:hypothetical protein
MSRRYFLPIGRSEIVCAIIDSAPSPRAAELISSGQLDRAARIAELTHSLTDSAIAEMEAELVEHGREFALDDVQSLRSAVFMGISRNVIDRVERAPNEAIAIKGACLFTQGDPA